MYPLDHAQAFVDNLKNAGKDAKLYVVKGELHRSGGFLISPTEL